jgi:hypothetical protein
MMIFFLGVAVLFFRLVGLFDLGGFDLGFNAFILCL